MARTNTNTDYYKLLGIEQDASVDDIKEACKAKLRGLQILKTQGKIDEEKYTAGCDYVKEIWNTLNDDVKRAVYDAGGSGSIGNSNEEEEKQQKKPRKTRNTGLFKKVIKRSAVTLGIGCAVFFFIWGGKKLANKTGANEGKATYMDYPDYNLDDYSNQPTVYNEGSKTYTDEKDAEIEALKQEINALKENQQQEQQSFSQTEGQKQDYQNQEEMSSNEPVNNETSNIPELVNYGDINDNALLEERATKMVNQLNAAGLYNIGTYAPYTVDEMKEIIQYVNGVYVPEDEVEALSKVDDFLNLSLAPLNNETFINIVNYQGGEDSFKKDVEAKAKNPNKVEFVKNMLFGNSNVGPYLQWLENQYYKMQTTTDRERCNKIYNNVMQSLAEFSFGDGFELNGKVYKEGMALGLDKVNSGNVLQALVYMIEPLRTANAKDHYTITDSHFSADKQKVKIPYLQISEWYTPLCDEKYYEYDENGRLLVDQQGDPQTSENFASVNQMNTTNTLLEQLYGKNEDYSKSLRK